MDESTSNECHEYANTQVTNFDSDSKPMSFASRNQNVAQSERSPRLVCYHQTWKLVQVSPKREGLQLQFLTRHLLKSCLLYLSPWMCLMSILPSIHIVQKSKQSSTAIRLLTRRRQASSFSRWTSNNRWSAVKYRRCHFAATALALGSCSWCMWKASHIDG